MTISHGLGARLNALKTESKFKNANARIISAGQPSSNSRAVMLEVNETILARSLLFENDTGAELGLEVADRRVRTVFSVQNLKTQVITDALINTPLTETDSMADLVQIIADFTKTAKEISVTTSASDIDAGNNIIGLPATLLSKSILGAKHVDDYTEFNPVHNIFGQLSDVEAWISFDDDGKQMSFGDDELASVLKVFTENNMDNIMSYLEQMAAPNSDNVCTLLGNLTGNGRSIVGLKMKRKLALAILDDKATIDLQGLCRRAL